MVALISPTPVHPSYIRTCNPDSADCLKFCEQSVPGTRFGTQIASLSSWLAAYHEIRGSAAAETSIAQMPRWRVSQARESHVRAPIVRALTVSNEAFARIICLALVTQSCHLVSARYFLLELAKTTLQRKTFPKGHRLRLNKPETGLDDQLVGLLPLVAVAWEGHHRPWHHESRGFSSFLGLIDAIS